MKKKIFLMLLVIPLCASEKKTYTDQDFIDACYKGNKEVVMHLLNSKCVKINSSDSYGNTGFIYACDKGEKKFFTGGSSQKHPCKQKQKGRVRINKRKSCAKKKISTAVAFLHTK